jgi:plasmid segregation protein ParM
VILDINQTSTRHENRAKVVNWLATRRVNMYEIVGLDAGNYAIKGFGDRGIIKLLSDIGEYRDRRLTQSHGVDDIIFEFKGRKGFAGSLARYESEFNGSIMGDTKAHEDTLIRVLLGLNKYGGDHFKVVVGQPISSHIREEKERIKEMLKGTHEIVINRKKRVLTIEEVEVAAEGGAAFWSNPIPGTVRVIDVGSGTVNGASLIDGRYLDRDSFTLKFGMNSTLSNDHEAMVRGIVAEALKKWGRGDTVMVAGGAAKQLTPIIKETFKKAATITPEYKGNLYEPMFANAIGFYKIGRKLWLN